MIKNFISNKLKKYLNSLINLAGHKRAKFFLGGWSFMENIFFPVPSDSIVIPMTIAKPKQWYEIFYIATIAATLGAIAAYFIGYYLFKTVGVTIFDWSGIDDPLFFQKKFYKKSTIIAFVIILFIAGFTPLPFNLLAITAGFVKFNFLIFLLTAIITRGGRYFLLTYLFSKFGPKIRKKIDTHFGTFMLWVVGSFIVVVSGMYLFYVSFPDFFE
ncbi:MAG: YqaA family protein [Candidatus Fonsibacter sp.]